MSEVVGPGSVSPSGAVLVARGISTHYILVVECYYHIADVLTNDFAAQSLVDQDEDGHLVWQGQVAGAGSTNQGSVLKVRPLGGPGRILRWASVQGHFYAVEWTTNLGTGFLLLSNRVEATPGTNSVLDDVHPDERSMFYRVRVVP